MSNLEKQLRELGKDEFESFVHQYLIARYPGAEIMRVEGAGGDAGIDSFQGQLDSGPSIWQSKHFPDRIRKSQQKQILKSVKTALRSSPTLWTLCVPINLRTPEHRWFELKVIEVYGGPKRIKLIQAADFLKELLHNRPLRDAFFPESALSNMVDLRKAITGTEDRTQEQLGSLTAEYAQQYLENQTAIEPRLQSVVTIGGTPEMRGLQQQHGLVFSTTEGERTTNYFARDIKAFNLDPIRLGVELPIEQRVALNAAIDAGKQFRVAAGNLLRVETSSPLLEALLEKADLSSMELELIPRLPSELAAKVMPLRLIAGSGQSSKVLDYVPFRVKRAGRREIALSSEGPLPIEISLVLTLSEGDAAKINIRPILRGADIERLNRVIQFLDELERSAELQVDSIEIDGPLLRASHGNMRSELDIPKELKDIVADAALIATTFRTPLRLPDEISNNDKVELQMLKRIASGEEFFDIDWNAVLTKAVKHQENALNGFNQTGFVMRVDHAVGWRTFRLFGKTIEPGPLTFIGNETAFLDVENTRVAYLAAREGDGISVRAHSAGPCRFVRNDWNPYSAVLIDATRM